MTEPVTVRYWGGAQRTAGRAEEQVVVATLGELRALISARPALAPLCEVASFLVDGQVATDATALPPGSVVDVLPPFAGGAQSEPSARLEITVSGRVQGVGFRYWVRSAATDLGLRGCATNLSDGSVEVRCEGPRGACDSLLAMLSGDRPPGWVGRIESQWSAPVGEPAGFRVG